MRRQSGMAMVEALVACAVLGLGLLGATRLTTHALGAALQTRQDVRAQALAADALGCAIARTEPCPAAEQVTQQGVTYTVQLQRSALDEALTEVSVRVQWSDGRSAAQGQRSLNWRSRVSTLPDWVGVSSP